MTAFLLAALLPLPAAAQASEDPPAAEAARALYFSGDVAKAAAAFEAAVKRSSSSAELAYDAAIAFEEAGRAERAIALYRRAAELAGDAEKETALGMALLRQGRAAQAGEAFERALARAPDDAWALLGAGRAKLASGRWDEAARLLARASDAAPGLTPADFYLGRAREAKGDQDGAAEAYRKAVAADSYFNEGRGPLSQAYLRLKRHNDAFRQLLRLAEAEPGSKLTRAMIEKVRPLLARAPEPRAAASPFSGPPAPRADTEAAGRAPALRVGLAATALGRVRPRRSAGVSSGGPWKALDPKTGRVLASAEAGEVWTARIIPPKRTRKKSKGRPRLELHGPRGRVAAVPGDAVLLRQDEPARFVFMLEGVPEREGWEYRGELEIALHGGRRTLRVVNVLGLEDYTHGVVSAEMPSRSPLEALKAQAVMARTHAYYLKLVHRFRHRKEGYDICDEQHCQVYGGVRAETERTRAVVAATRGVVAVYDGRPAQVIYSSHCGGRTQSGREIGWGDVPYWKGVDDAASSQEPRSPARLRRALSRWPAEAFCRPSGYVHASHARWTRVIPAKALEEKLSRRIKIGRLKGLRVVKRARSGHVSALLVLGARRNARLTDELDIRGLLGVGSLRSTLFVVDAEYKPEPSIAPRQTIGPPKGRKAPRPAPVKLVLDAFVFRGGGWGHGVGFCQSGAMGRAEAGQDYEAIVKTYFTGIGLSRLDY